MTRRRRRSVANRGLGAPIRPSSLPLPRSRERPAAGPARLPRRQRQGRARLSADPADRLPRGRVSATGLPVPRRAPCREQSSAGALSRSRRCPPRRSTRRRFRHAARRARGQSPIRAPARRARLKSGCLPESLEDVGQKRRIDALPIIAHDDVGRGVPELQAQLHVPAARVNFTALESRYLGVSEDRVQRRTQLVRARRQQFVLQSVRLMGAAVRRRIVDRERGPCRQILGEGAFPLQAPTFEDGNRVRDSGLSHFDQAPGNARGSYPGRPAKSRADQMTKVDSRQRERRSLRKANITHISRERQTFVCPADHQQAHSSPAATSEPRRALA